MQLDVDTVRNADGTGNVAGVLNREAAFVRRTGTRRGMNSSSVLSVEDASHADVVC